MKRNDVYKVIDTERDFQNEMVFREDRPDMIEDFHVGDGITAIEYNIQKAREAWYKGSVPHDDAMIYLRKIAAICVQLGEKYCMPERYKSE